MSFADKIKRLIRKHPDKVDKGIDKLGDLVDKATKHKHANKVDKAQLKAKKAARSVGKKQPPPY